MFFLLVLDRENIINYVSQYGLHQKDICRITIHIQCLR